MLLLGAPDTLYFLPRADGGVLVRVVSFDADDDDVLANRLQDLPPDGWERIGSLRVVDSPLLAFDSAVAGNDASGDALRVALAPGRYGVSSTTFAPDDETELMLTRLWR